MPKCGCAGQGSSVLIEGGAGVTVSGTGTSENPYRITAEQLFLAVADTPTIDLTLVGDGSQVNPYTLSAAFVGTINPPNWRPSESRTWTAGPANLTDVTTPRTIRVNMTGNVTVVNLPTWASSDSGSIMLMITQDATGGRTWVQPGTSENGVDVVLSTAPGARDLVEMFWTGIQWVVRAVAKNVS